MMNGFLIGNSFVHFTDYALWHVTIQN